MYVSLLSLCTFAKPIAWHSCYICSVFMILYMSLFVQNCIAEVDWDPVDSDNYKKTLDYIFAGLKGKVCIIYMCKKVVLIPLINPYRFV